MQVYVLLFNPGTDNEGIHTLKMKEDGRDVVLMFESEDDAARFGLMLEAQDFLAPNVESIDSEEVEEFCQQADFEALLVPEGTLAMPPDASLDRTDWQPDQAAPRNLGGRGEATSAPNPDQEKPPPDFSGDELARIRQRLEGLL